MNTQSQHSTIGSTIGLSSIKGFSSSLSTEKVSEKSWFEKQVQKVEDTIFYSASMMIMIQTTIGAVSVASVLQYLNSFSLLLLCVSLTMGVNAFFIGQVSAKWCLRMFIASLAVNLSVIAYANII